MKTHRRNHPHLMRTGYAVTGCGLAVLTWAVAALLSGAGGGGATAVIVGTIAGLAATMGGFATMVIAADPFEDEEIEG